MFKNFLINLKNSVYNWINQNIENIYSSIEYYSPKVIWALIILICWFFLAWIIYKFIIYFFKKFKIIKFVDDFFVNIRKTTIVTKEKNKAPTMQPSKKFNFLDLFKKKKKKDTKTETLDQGDDVLLAEKVSDQIKIDDITAKSLSYYVILLSFRTSIQIIWITEVEKFLDLLVWYLPKLFVAVMILFFWIRFANFIYDTVFHALMLTRQKTAKIIAVWARMIVLFFVLMWVLSQIWVANTITETIFKWVVAMVCIAWWLAFWLGWKDLAKEILESFKK